MSKETIEIPRKLLEQVFLDYIMYRSCYFTDKKEEAEKMKEDCYWKPEENENINETYNEIKHILEQ